MKRAGKTTRLRKFSEIETSILVHRTLNFICRKNKHGPNLEPSKGTGKFSTDIKGLGFVYQHFH